MKKLIARFAQTLLRSASGGSDEKGQPSMVTLRDIRQPGDSRSLTASLAGDGSLEIVGLDYGDGVEQSFGQREYEWRWHVEPAEVVKLQEALDTQDHLMTALQARFSGHAAANLQSFLNEHQIVYKSWSRVGD